MSWWDEGENLPTEGRVSIEIEEQAPVTHNTGILAPDGNPIYWTERRQPIGFIRIGEDED